VRFAVTDVETTGASNKITEIAIYVYDSTKNRIVDEYQSLVNPEGLIPPFIVNLTGITNEMVADAPVFEEIAEDVLDMTKDCVFVAHNVNFDYHVIRSEYALLGQEFNRPRLCTVRLSRKAFPGLPSYSLGKLCRNVGINLENRHRAAGDAKATTILLQKVFVEGKEELVTKALNARSKEATLPPNLSKTDYQSIPDRTGVYLFHNGDGKVIYVGKAKNLKQRIDGHFASTNARKIQMKGEIHDIDFILTGSEFLALLIESVEIKHHFPVYNKAQKYSGNAYSICKYEARSGVTRLDIVKTRKGITGDIVSSFSNQMHARNFLQQLVSAHDLCPIMCGLQKISGPCLNHQAGMCAGVCCGEEAADSYNSRLHAALEDHVLECGDYLCLMPGRKRGEKSFVFVEKGIYKGYGFLDSSESYETPEAILDHLIPQKHNAEIGHILRNNIHRLQQTNILKMMTL
jgi:DNA polymerase-3 subunit epsilon